MLQRPLALARLAETGSSWRRSGWPEWWPAVALVAQVVPVAVATVVAAVAAEAAAAVLVAVAVVVV